MGRFRFLTLVLGVATCLSSMVPAKAVIVFQPGHFYGTFNLYSDPTLRRIYEYDAFGNPIGSLLLPSLFHELRGLAFGPDNLLYVVSPDPQAGPGFSVRSIDETGSIHATYYYGNSYTNGNLAHGKITFDGAGHFSVGSLAGVIRFDRGNTNSGTLIYSAPIGGSFDVKGLPNGHLLVANDYSLQEITSDGTFVRNITPSGAPPFTQLRGIEYEPATNAIFAYSFGTSSNPDPLIKLDGTTGAFLAGTTFVHGGDLVIASDGRLIAASIAQTPGIFSQAPLQTGYFAGTPQPVFITEYVPEPSMVFGIIGLILLARKSASGR